MRNSSIHAWLGRVAFSAVIPFVMVAGCGDDSGIELPTTAGAGEGGGGAPTSAGAGGVPAAHAGAGGETDAGSGGAENLSGAGSGGESGATEPLIGGAGAGSGGTLGISGGGKGGTSGVAGFGATSGVAGGATGGANTGGLAGAGPSGESGAGGGGEGGGSGEGGTHAAGSGGESGEASTNPECTACVEANACTADGDCGVFDSRATEGPAIGIERELLCNEVLSCLRATQCMLDCPEVPCESPEATVAACYGTNESPGPCHLAMQRGFETEEAAFVIERLQDDQFAGARAAYREDCEIGNCGSVCLREPN